MGALRRSDTGEAAPDLPGVNRVVLTLTGLGALMGAVLLAAVLVGLTAFALYGGESESGPAESGDTGLIVLIAGCAAAAAAGISGIAAIAARLLVLGVRGRRVSWRFAWIAGSILAAAGPVVLLAPSWL